MIIFNILTLFPESFSSFIEVGLLGKAFKNKLFKVNTINIREYSNLSAKSVDDKPFSGGPGMVLRPDVISKAIEENFDQLYLKKCLKICFSAKGVRLNQDYLNQNLQVSDFIILNGRYEGIDQRVIDYYGFEEICVGDVILNGGEIATQLFIESFMRLQPNVLGNENTHIDESFQNDLLEHDQYTRPNPWIAPDNKSLEVPLTLTSGHHADIEVWKKDNSIENTQKNRPDLFKKYLKKNKNE